jgi:hypothetical protein
MHFGAYVCALTRQVHASAWVVPEAKPHVAPGLDVGGPGVEPALLVKHDAASVAGARISEVLEAVAGDSCGRRPGWKAAGL